MSVFAQGCTAAWDGEDAYVGADVCVCVCELMGMCAVTEGLFCTYSPCRSFHMWLRDGGNWQLCSQPHCGGLCTWV